MANTYISRTFGTPTNSAIWTLSVWIKRSGLSSNMQIFTAGSGSTDQTRIGFNSSNQFTIDRNLSGSIEGFTTTRLFRDTNAWYHLVVQNNSGTVALYVNGISETLSGTSFGTNKINVASTIHIFGDTPASGENFDGLMSHIHFVDGTIYAPTVFGSTDSTTGEWQINTSPSITMGNNGFTILKDGNTITDQSANSNNFSLSSGTLTKTEDCPSNVFATLNPLEPMGSNVSFENGNASFKCSNDSFRMFKSTLGMSSGKFYWEFKPTVDKGGDFAQIGILDAETFDPDDYIGNETYGYAYMFDGRKNVPAGASSYGATWTTNDIISVAFDMDNRKLYFAKNGTWQNSGVPTSGSTGTGAISVSATPSTFMVAGSIYEGSGGAPIYQYNFGNGYFGTTAVSSAGTNASGNGIFEYDTPTGYTALSTKGLNL